MTAVFFIHPLKDPPPPPIERKDKALEAQPWGTPTGEEVEHLLDTVQQAVEGSLVYRSEAIGLLIQCHMMLHRCREASAPIARADGKAG